MANPMQAAGSYMLVNESRVQIGRNKRYPPENMDTKETCFRVLGSDITMPISMTMMENKTMHCEWSEKVFNIFAPVRTWKPIRMMLLASSMKTVTLYAIRLFPKTQYAKPPGRNELGVRFENHRFSIEGMDSHISLIWGFFMMNLCIVIEVIQKRMPTTAIVVLPGTHPRTLQASMSML